MEFDSAIVGYGVVGQATAKALKIKRYYDLDPKKSNIQFKDLAKFKFLFLCLPTPVLNKNKYKTAHITQIIGKLIKLNPTGLIIIRSTVYPGFAKKLQQKFSSDRIVSNPEFLSEKTAYRDTKYPPFILLGGVNKKLLNEVKKKVGKFINSQVIFTDNTTAELAKLSMNTYFSTKVIFANQVYDLAQSMDADYEKIKKVLELHPFGPHNHFTIWYNNKRGVHGNCLPKDTKAFLGVSKSPLIKSVLEINKKYVNLNKE